MRAKVQQVYWHGKDTDPGAVYSLDFNPATGVLATCGSDREIKLWEVVQDGDGAPGVRHLDTLTGHSRTVNALRFSPGGDLLASAGDSGEVILWRPAPVAPGSAPCAPALGSAEGSLGSWKQHCVLRGHTDDVQDVCWSPDGQSLATGSVDGRTLVWDVTRRASPVALEGHAHYVQGVAWDPQNQFLASQSGDRTARVYSRVHAAKAPAAFALAAVLSRAPPAPVGPATETGPPPPPMRAPLFHDENMASFFRRLAWSPCGTFLALPAGMTMTSSVAGKGCVRNAVWLFKRGVWGSPAATLPGPNVGGGKAVAVRFCPLLFRHRGEGDGAAAPAPAQAAPPGSPVFELPYRVLFAVATLEHVLLYDTASAAPLALLASLHYAPITDLAWAPDGLTLAMSSQDGYCSLVTFESGELGTPCSAEELPEGVAARLQAAAVSAAKARAEEPEHAPPHAPPHAQPQPAAQPGASAGDGAGPRRITPMAMGGARRIAPEPFQAPTPAPAPPAVPLEAGAEEMALGGEEEDAP